MIRNIVLIFIIIQQTSCSPLTQKSFKFVVHGQAKVQVPLRREKSATNKTHEETHLSISRNVNKSQNMELYQIDPGILRKTPRKTRQNDSGGINLNKIILYIMVVVGVTLIGCCMYKFFSSGPNKKHSASLSDSKGSPGRGYNRRKREPDIDEDSASESFSKK